MRPEDDRTTRALMLAVAAALMAGLCGCGGGSPGPSVAGAGPTPSATSTAGGKAQISHAELAYAQCMRSNGVPNFPDPGPQGWTPAAYQRAGIDEQSPVVQGAQQACKSRMATEMQGATPPGAAELVAFGQCVRAHGYPGFPDPTAPGGVIHLDWRSVGLTGSSPAAQSLVATCGRYLQQHPSGGGS